MLQRFIRCLSRMSPSSAPFTAQRYNVLAIALHWLLALALVAIFGLGLYMHELPFSPQRLKLYSWHKWAGITILALSALRLLWRTLKPPPPLPEAVLRRMPGWQHLAHRATHGLMYLLFFAVPLSGWAYSSAAGFPVVWLGLVPLPDWVPVDPALATTIKSLHMVLSFSLAALVVLHVLAVLKHQLLDRDGLLKRMLPGRA
jgi:cytochrome b561